MTLDRQDLEKRILTLTACVEPTPLQFIYASGKTGKIGYDKANRRFFLWLGKNQFVYADNHSSIATVLLMMGDAEPHDAMSC